MFKTIAKNIYDIWMNSYKEFKDFVNDKKLFCVPIFSMFDHQSHICNMQCDGNAARYITTFNKANTFNTLTIFCPNKDNAINIDFFKSGFENNTNIIEDSSFKNHAAYMRESEFTEDFYDKIHTLYKNYFDESDIVFFEGQDIGLKLLDNKENDKIYVYWCPVCATDKKTRTFLELNKEKDLELFKRSDYVIVCSEDQVDYLSRLGYSDKLFYLNELTSRDIKIFNDYERSTNLKAFLDYIYWNGKYVVYMPYRISDEGYRVREILDILYKTKNKNFVIFCPNLNKDNLIENWQGLDEDKIEFYDKYIYKISDDKSTYCMLLDWGHMIVIPYFEDIKFIMHGTANELMSPHTTAKVFFDIEEFAKFVESCSLDGVYETLYKD